ncbi:D-3-phosphoglycerate dehydrogenase [Arboricoccus pini]|uniref:D-3-phosphoglycerate dehydrogenase n=1 Tax=Arboricoccus pini TaxID=1963835 RepID=A0A212RIS6_9PROT|nr:NAD(P)-dependent oxidoreductase [Arboricoccus pini]SNB72196.1 D-3-phosphoglycerate dehydrogenase [Arboricoccus pini]
MKGLFLDASDGLADIYRSVGRDGDPEVVLREISDVPAGEITKICRGYDYIIDDHTFLPTSALVAAETIKNVVFLGTGARSYMHVDELEAAGIKVHTIKGYGDTAVAEHAFALMWAGARGIAAMDRGMRKGGWLSVEGPQLTGKTVGLLGVGGVGTEMARLCAGVGMKVIAWNRTKRDVPNVTFVELETLVAESDVLSVHLLLTDETRHFVDAAMLAKLKPGCLLVNTARGAVIDEAAMVEALKSGHLFHAALDVYETEPLPAGHPLASLENATLSPHAAFRTPEATQALVRGAIDIAKSLG